MKPSRGEEDIQRLLRHAPAEAPAAGECPDPETLAAWREGGLTPAAGGAVEVHVADCSRCLMQLAAITRMEPANAASSPPMFKPWAWLVPAAATAATIGVWLLVRPPQTYAPQSPPAAVEEKADVAEKNAAASDRLADDASARRLDAPRPVPRREPQPDQALQSERQRSFDGRAAAPAPSAPAAAEFRSGNVVAPLPESVAEADLQGAKVDRFADGTVAWDRTSPGLLSQVTAGVSPAPSVIWLVGRGGLILLSPTEGIWRRLPFPEPVDLAGVRAVDAAEASVTTADGRTFTTRDSGLTWVRQ